MSPHWIYLCLTLATLIGTSRAQAPSPLSGLAFRGQQIIDVAPSDRVAYAVHQLNNTMLIMAYSGAFGSLGPAIRFVAMDRNDTGFSSRTLTTKNFTAPENVGNITSALHMVYDSGDVALIYQNEFKMCMQVIGLRPPPGQQQPPPPGSAPPIIKFSDASFPHISTISYATTQPPAFSIIFSKFLTMAPYNGSTCLIHQNAGFGGLKNISQFMFCTADAEMDPLAETWYHPTDTTSFFVIAKALMGGATTFQVRRCTNAGSIDCPALSTGPLVTGLSVPDPNIDMVASRRIQSDKFWFAWRATGKLYIVCLQFSQTSVVAVSNVISTDIPADSFNLVDSVNQGGVGLIVRQSTVVSRHDFVFINDTDIGPGQSLTLDTLKLGELVGYPFPLATESIDGSAFALLSTSDDTSVSLNYFAVTPCECDVQAPFCNSACQCLYGTNTSGSCLESAPVTNTPSLVPSTSGNAPASVPAAGGNTPSSDGVSGPTAPSGLTSDELVRIVVPSVVIPVVVAAGVAVLVVLLQRRKKSKKVKDDKVRLEPANYQSMPGANSALPNDSKSSQATSGEHTSIPIGLAPLNTMSTDERMKIPYSDLKVIREIGSGAYGKVFLGEWQMTQVALKVSGISSSEEFIREAELLINLRPHPNVVQILGVSTDGLNVVMIMEYCDGGSLDHLVKGELSMETKIKYLSGIAKGIYHLHKNNIIHRDLAARNILLSRGEPKISDFGMSRKVQEAASHGQTRSTVGPLRWMAPESLKSAFYSSKSDVWSFGILLWEVLTGKEPHLDTDPLAIGIEIRDKGLTPPIPDNLNPELVQLLRDCWQLDPELRPDFAEICKRINRIQP